MNKDNIKRIDFEIATYIRNSDQKNIAISDINKLSAVFNSDNISPEEVTKLIKNNNYLNNENIMILLPSEADKISNIFS